MRQETKTELTARTAVRDAANAARVVEEYTSFVRVQTLDGNWSSWQRNRRRFVCDGEPVNLNDDGTFALARTGELLTKIP